VDPGHVGVLVAFRTCLWVIPLRVVHQGALPRALPPSLNAFVASTLAGRISRNIHPDHSWFFFEHCFALPDRRCLPWTERGDTTERPTSTECPPLSMFRNGHCWAMRPSLLPSPFPATIAPQLRTIPSAPSNPLFKSNHAWLQMNFSSVPENDPQKTQLKAIYELLGFYFQQKVSHKARIWNRDQ